MAQSPKDNRIVIKDTEATGKLLEGAQALYDTVVDTYGPRGRNVMIEKPFGRPLITRDGVTVAREVYFKDRAKNMGAQALLEASETTNRIAGDGTTATVALGYHLMKQGIQAIAAGMHPMEVRDTLTKDGEIIHEAILKASKPTKKSQLKEVATVSSGDPVLGELIAEAVEYVGPNGGIFPEKAPLSEVERTYVDGYYLQVGFQALQAGRKEMSDPFVIVSTRHISSAPDVVTILTKLMELKKMQPGSIPQVLFIGEFEDAAYNLIVNLINQGKIDAVVIKTPPQFGEMGKFLLEDIAIYAGCVPLTDATKIRDFNDNNIGAVDRVVAKKDEATLFCSTNEDRVTGRVAEIQSQIDVETVDAINEKLRERISKLEGKIALFKIGGATDTVKEELEFRVEDAILATRAAYTDGVVPGGGITLLVLSQLPISHITSRALQNTFKQLFLNAGLPAEVRLNEVLSAPKGHGYNLRKNEGLVDMVAEGILDPTLVVDQVTTNALAATCTALTNGTLVIFEDAVEA